MFYYLPKSFPKPDCLKPPNGAATSVLLYVLTNTVPASIFSATYIARLISFVKTPEASPNSVLFARLMTPSTSLEDKTHYLFITYESLQLVCQRADWRDEKQDYM